MNRLSQGLRRTLSLVIFSISVTSLVACSSMSTQQKEVIYGDDIANQPPRNHQFNEELLFNLLAGEFAGVRGQMDESISYYSAAAEMSNDPGVIVRAAYIALYSGNDQQAIDLTDRWLSLNLPEEHTVSRIRVLAFLHLQQLDPAVESIEKLLITDGKVNEHAVASLTHIFSKETTPEFSLQVAERLNQKYPQQPFLVLLLAKFEANLGRYEQALLHTNQLIQLDSELVDAYLVKAQILAGQGHQQQAMDAIAMAVSKRPADTRLRLQYGRMLVQMKAFDKAKQQFLTLKKYMPNDENVLLSLGLLSIETGDQNQAKIYLQELLDKGHHNQQAHYYLGRIQQNQGEDMAAIANYERVVAGEYWLDARIRSAILLARSGQIDAALSRLESLSKRDNTEKNQIKVYLARGEVLREASRNQEAYSLYNAALANSPENTDLLYARALTAEKLNMLDVTESDLKMVLMHEPENASALNALGYTLADRTERLNEAREYILKAAELLPDDPAILDSLGWVYYRLGQYQDAIKWLSKAFEKLQDAEIAAHLGEVLWVSGQTEKALDIWQKGEKLDGNKAVLRDTIQRFKQ